MIGETRMRGASRLIWIVVALVLVLATPRPCRRLP